MPTPLVHFRGLAILKKWSPSDNDPTTTLAAKTLHSVLLFAIPFAALFLTVGVPFFALKKPAAAVFCAFILVTTLACMALLKRGYVRLSSWIFVSTVWLILALSVVLTSGIRSSAVMSHITVIVVSVWLLGRREGMWIAGLSLAFSLSLAIMESRGIHLPRYFPGPPFIAWAFGAGLVGLTILPIASVNQALADSAAQARRELEARLREERARAESEERFRATFFQAAVGIVQTDLNGRWQLVNDRLCEILGYSPTELRGAAFLDLTHPEDREASGATLRQFLQGEISSCSLEKRYVRKDGNTVWARVFVKLVRNPHDQPQYFITVFEDISEKIQAERALRETEERLTLAQNAAGLGIWDWEPSKGIITVGGKYAYLHGLANEPNKISFEEWLSSTHPEDRDRLHAIARQCLEGLRDWDIEFRVVWPDATVHWLRGKGSVLVDDSGRPIRVTGICMDITGRKQAEAALRNSQQLLELAQDAAGIGSFDRDEVTGVVCCSKGFPVLYGLPPSEVGLSYEQWLERIHPGDRTTLDAGRVGALQTGSSWETEFRVIWPDGSTHWLFSKGKVLRDGYRNSIRTVGVNMDITERKQAEENLRSSQRRLELAQAAAGVATYDWDFRALVGHCSKEFPAMYGLPPSEIGPPYEQWVEMIHPEDRTRILLERAKTFESEREWDTEFRVIWPDGSVHWLYARGNLLRDPEGNPSRMIGVNMDITARKRAEDESVARQKLEGLGVLAGGIAHDFNNMLGAILAESELLREDVAENAPARAEVNNIVGVVNRAAAIVRELMVYAGNEETVLEPVDLSMLVREMLKLLRVSISKQAKLEIDLPEGLPYVRANEAQIAQVVMNLITNASEALEEKQGVISVSVARSGEDIRLQVGDTGRGMTEEVKGRIFDPFFSTKFSGRGMGLAAVQGIIRKHGGKIDVASIPGQGSRFTILLSSISERGPVARASASTISDVPPAGNAGTVLVVEDEEPLRLAVSKMLRKERFQVIEASDGRTGVDLFLANAPAIGAVLLDMTLPGLSGREVLQELRRIRHDVKVILTTAYSQDAALAALSGERPWGFIRKPYRLSELAQLLRNACQQTRS
jgi:PAS domain S-box-containing protein